MRNISLFRVPTIPHPSFSSWFRHHHHHQRPPFCRWSTRPSIYLSLLPSFPLYLWCILFHHVLLLPARSLARSGLWMMSSRMSRSGMPDRWCSHAAENVLCIIILVFQGEIMLLAHAGIAIFFSLSLSFLPDILIHRQQQYLFARQNPEYRIIGSKEEGKVFCNRFLSASSRENLFGRRILLLRHANWTCFHLR